MSIYKGTTLIAGALPNSANQDLSNITNIATTEMAHNAIPSETYVDLTLGASGSTYTAPADGWVKCTIDVNANGMLDIQRHWVQAGSVSGYITIEKPVYKNQRFYISYSNYRSTIEFKFFYANGSAWEA